MNKGVVTLFYKQLTIIDACLLDPLMGLMGQSWMVDVYLTGETDEESVVADFSIIKQKIKSLIDQYVDHRILVDQKLVQLLDGVGKFNYSYGSTIPHSLEYVAPEQAFCLLPYSNANTESIQVYLNDLLIKQMPKNILEVEVKLREEENPITFHYTHGLKQHYGNCQRLFHGHRNTIEIWRNGVRNEKWEEQLSKEVFKGNIHFAFWDNIANKKAILSLSQSNGAPEGILHGDQLVEISYDGNQGKFTAKIPAQQVFILPCETTIENIAAYFARWVKTHWAQPTDRIMVVGYEGIGKGARATCH